MAAKRRIAKTYEEACAVIPGLRPMREASWARSSFWIYTVLVDEATYGMSSRQLMRRLLSRMGPITGVPIGRSPQRVRH